MNLATASSRFVKHLRVRLTRQAFAPSYGEVRSIRMDPADRLNTLVTVHLNSGRIEEFSADELAPTENTFRCEFCHKHKPDHLQRKVFGVSIPRSCVDCYPAAQRFFMNQAANQAAKRAK